MRREINVVNDPMRPPILPEENHDANQGAVRQRGQLERPRLGHDKPDPQLLPLPKRAVRRCPLEMGAHDRLKLMSRIRRAISKTLKGI